MKNSASTLFVLTISISALGLALVGCPNETTIYTDINGVPHIYADTEYEVMYGFGYAMARDQLETIVPLYRTANGTVAAMEGEGSGGANIYSDYISHLFRVPQSAEAAYAGMSDQERSWLDGFSAGLNRYIKEYNRTHTPDVETFGPADVLAWSIYTQFNRQLSHAQGDLATALESRALASLAPESDATASNQWVVGPPKTGGPAMVLADPHLPWFGGNQWYEAHLRDTAGVLNVTGAAVVGAPFIAMGRNENVAWSMTSNGMLDMADCYEERLVNPSDYSEYVYDGDPSGRKPIVEKTITIPVKGASPFVVPAYYTHHGPVVPLAVEGEEPVFSPDGEHVYSLALSMMDGTVDDYPGDLIAGTMLQAYRFDTARSVRDIKLALGLQGEPDSLPMDEVLQMVKWNIVMGDRSGDIFYIFNGRIPVRVNPHQEDSDYWDRARQGWTGEDEWTRNAAGLAVHWAIADLPQVANPASGFLSNCNVSPWHVCPDSGIEPDDFPYYVCIESDTDRNRMARELLEGNEEITGHDMREYSLDVHILKADKLESLFFSFYDASIHTDLVDEARLLDSEPNEATKENTSVALIYTWSSTLGGAIGGLPEDPADLTQEQQDLLLASLREARDFLESCPCGLAPEWGEVHLIDHGGIFPVGGGTGSMPTLFMVDGPLVEECGPMVGDRGSSFMQVSVLDAETATSRSVRPIGSSSDPGSHHYNDETNRYVLRDPEESYKANPFTDQEVLDYAEDVKTLKW